MTAEYRKELLRAYPNIKQIWLIGSRARAGGSAKSSSDWDYIVMADQSTLDALSAAPHFNDPVIDLLVIYDGNQFRKPWPDGDREKHGSLIGWEWKKISKSEATYKATKPQYNDDFCSWITTLGRAVRVYPCTG